MTNILVIGASGNVSSRIVALLANEKSVSLRLTSTRDEGVNALKAAYPDADVLRADWYDLPSLKAAFAGMNRVVVIPPDFVTDEEVATPNVIAAAQSTPGLELIVRMLANSEQKDEEIDPELKSVQIGSGLHAIAQSIYNKSDVPVAFINCSGWFNFVFTQMIAEDVKAHKQIRLPHDASRFWLDEDDLAAAFVKVLLEGPEKHLGKHYRVTGLGRYRFGDIAAALSAELGETIGYVDTEDGIRESTGEDAEALITYLKHDSLLWDKGYASPDFYNLMGRDQKTLTDYIHRNRDLFI